MGAPLKLGVPGAPGDSVGVSLVAPWPRFRGAQSLPREASALALSTAPGLGYGRCWNRGPAAVVSAPVLASLRLGSPVDHVPLQGHQRGHQGSPKTGGTPIIHPQTPPFNNNPIPCWGPSEYRHWGHPVVSQLGQAHVPTPSVGDTKGGPQKMETPQKWGHPDNSSFNNPIWCQGVSKYSHQHPRGHWAPRGVTGAALWTTSP